MVDTVAPNGDARAMWIRFVGAHFTNHLRIGDFFLPIHRDVSTANSFKCVPAPDALVAWSISSFAYVLAQSAQFVEVLCITTFLLLGMIAQLSVFEGLSRLEIGVGNSGLRLDHRKLDWLCMS